MTVCQHCHAIVPERNLRCADCGAALTTKPTFEFPPPTAGARPVAPPALDVSPLSDLNRDLDPDDFLRQLLGSGDHRDAQSATPPQASRPSAPPGPASPPIPPAATTPLAATTPPVAPAPRPVPELPPRPMAAATRPPERQNVAPPPPPSGQPRTSMDPTFAKSGDSPVHVSDVYSVTARSNRLGTAATLGRADNHGVLVGAAIAGATAVFAIGALAGWASWDAPQAAGAVTSAEATSPDDSPADVIPDAVRGSFVQVDGAYCDGSPVFGFVTSKVVIVPADLDLAATDVRLQYFTGDVDTGTPIGVTPDGRFLVIRPDTTPRTSLERGMSVAIPNGSTVSVVNLERLAQSADGSFQSLQVVSSDHKFDDSFWTYFDQQGLNPNMPIIDEDNRLRATVSADGTHAVSIGALGHDISSLKLNPADIAGTCSPSGDTASEDPATDGD